ncbi:MAG TPA: hypoxanthine-guanine phosphoribosyltransferase [Gammaproteobacteria bacterium]|nr:hypoxanthine-guanine phosphoribosyltransferase [Gammaproteobacteria bacterium]|tara:strand:- start:1358 stop:1903 length:546 start_codon:yes stop_codon:yes gene_type:complete
MLDKEIISTRQNADQLFTEADVEQSIDNMATQITARLEGRNPLLLTVMNGGMVITSRLLSRLDFPLQVDYVHPTRYGNETSGKALEWIRQPPATVKGRTVLLIDDILDQGITLQSVVNSCQDIGASEVLTAVLLVKLIPQRAGLTETDFFGISTPDRYIFGSGMDYKTYWRNGTGIFAVRD